LSTLFKVSKTQNYNSILEMFGTKQNTTECTALLSHLKGKSFALYHCNEGIKERYRLAFQLISWALATQVLFYPGYPFLSNASAHYDG